MSDGCYCATTKPSCGWCENSAECAKCGKFLQRASLEESDEELYCEPCFVELKLGAKHCQCCIDEGVPASCPGLPARKAEGVREEIAKILEVIAKDGLPGPRDLDVALDAIDEIYKAAS